MKSIPKSDFSLRTRPRFLVGIMLLLSFSLRVYRLDSQSLWWDEMYTAARAAMTIPELIQNLFEARVHLPLYFLLLQPWSDVSLSAFYLRFISVIWGVLTVALIYRVGKLLDGVRVGLLAALLLTISPFHLWFSQEARMYSFLAFNALLATWILLRQLQGESNGRWLAYTVAMTLTLYSHYLGTVILIAHYTFFSLHYSQLKALFRRWFVAAGTAGALFAAWFLAVYFISSFSQASISWIQPARWYEPLLTLLSFSIGPSIDPTHFLPYLAFLVYLIGLGSSAFFLLRPKTPQDREMLANRILNARLLFIGLFVPLILVTLISFDWPIPQQRSVYMDRYLISTLPFFMLLTAWGLVLLQRRKGIPRVLLTILLAAILIPTFFTWRNLYFSPVYARENWRDAFAYLESNWREEDAILLTPGQILPLFYYTDGTLPHYVLPSLGEFAIEEQEEKTAQTLQTQLNEMEVDVTRVWIMQGYDNANPHGFPQTRNQRTQQEYLNLYDAWMNQNATLAADWQSMGIRLRLYIYDR